MIFVDRTRVKNPLDPSTKLGERALQETAAVAEQMQNGNPERKRPMFKIYVHEDVKAALNELFHGKCAYCECRIQGFPGDVEHFRPKINVTEAPEHPGYWWLANTWENILIACVDCNRQRVHDIAGEKGRVRAGKGSRFPLADENARVFSPDTPISEEQPLLLDPTSDRPEDHLVFDMNGTVYSDTERGNTTIAVLGLNRQSLVSARREKINEFETLLAANLVAGHSDEITDLLERFVLSDAPFAGMMRQVVESTYVSDQLQGVWQDGFEAQRSRLEEQGVRSTEETTEERVDRAREAQEVFKAGKSSYSFESAQGLADFRTIQPLIERIEITNIRAIRELDLVLGSDTQDLRSWLMLLGENGTGKSTVLQSVALALSGHDQVHRLVAEKWIEPASLIRLHCDFGTIAVRLSGFSEPHRLTVFPDRLEFRSPQGEEMTIFEDGRRSGTGWEAQTLVLAYGATRLMAHTATTEKTGGDYSRIDNLFHPFVPLIDAQAWLLGLDNLRFTTARDILKGLLDLEEAASIEPNDDRTEILIKRPGETVRVKDLSDGYRTVLAMAADMLDVLSRIWPDLSEAVGIVLVDELDSHLHPTWQMKIVGALRYAMGGVQFLATTHQPLCLRGLEEGEVVVMRRSEEGLIDMLTDLPSPAKLRVDQLLTSDFFGLKSTIDPDVEKMFDQYYALLALTNPTDDQLAEISKLNKELKGRQQMGNSMRENLFYSTIDKLLAQQETEDRQPPKVLEEELADKIGSMWKDALRSAGVEQ